MNCSSKLQFCCDPPNPPPEPFSGELLRCDEGVGGCEGGRVKGGKFKPGGGPPTTLAMEWGGKREEGGVRSPWRKC